MEVYRTKDGQVSKYVHDDGSETAIKTVSSCANVYDKETGRIVPIEKEREKFSVFISSSVGCPIGCKFCYLTVKKFPYQKLGPWQIVKNVRSALISEVEKKPELKNKYIKLSWMGMGDALLLDAADIDKVTIAILDLVLCGPRIGIKGLDGVDISTVMPPKAKGWPFHLGVLNGELLNSFQRNPHSMDRSPLRLFYSLHSEKLIPSRKRNGVWNDFKKLKEFNYWYNIDIILHHMFLDGVNDKKSDVELIQALLERTGLEAELRVLRYNECPNSEYRESRNFDELVSYAAEIMPKVKYQVSAGSEIKAACGQFLCVRYEKGE